ncbi:MAG: aminotransferase class I/II-fold pyridoxal phosphate-dependent enzyme [Marinosulfonomonas sp.]|nr:aminotransferase class I/II-fold pyridoxal phosphate-dependent enzyme [Marinosulfonomonas sp.]
MAFPERFSNLPEYVFPRLRALLDPHSPGGDVVHMSIGEPKHPFPAWVSDVIAENAAEFGRYPPNDGSPELRAAISAWVAKRFGVSLDAETQIVSLNGTREGLFNACIALCPEKTKQGKRPVVLVPNPFYQVYAIAAATVGAEIVYVPATENSGFLPDFDSIPADILDRAEIAYLCSPSNPQGAVADREYLASFIKLAEKHDFRIFSDECYSEIYRDTPPLSALKVAVELGADLERILIFHSLSKRSSLPGLRSGFVAGGAANISEIKKLRAYSGAPIPLPLQRVSEKLWADETHVATNRALYVEKFDMADQVFSSQQAVSTPQAGLFLWLPVDDSEAATLKLWKETGIRVLPGEYLGRETNGLNPASNYIRVAMVAPKDDVQRDLIKLRDCLFSLG